MKEGRTGIIISGNINLEETVMTGEEGKTTMKEGISSGSYTFDRYAVDLRLLHNTHSWVVLAVNG